MTLGSPVARLYLEGVIDSYDVEISNSSSVFRGGVKELRRLGL